MGIYQKMIEEAVSHTPLEAMLAKQLDKQDERILKIERLIDTYSYQHATTGTNKVVFD